MSEHRIFQYVLDDVDRELVDKEKNGIQYIKRKTFKKAVDDGLEYSIVGKTRLRKAQDGDEEDYDLLVSGEDRFLMKPYRYRWHRGYIPLGKRKYVEYAGFWLPILIFKFGFLLALLLFCLHSCSPAESVPQSIIQPAGTAASQTEEEERKEPEIYLYVHLPDGASTYSGLIYEPQEKKTSSSDSANAETASAKASPSPSPTETAAAEEETEEKELVSYTGKAHIKINCYSDDGKSHTVVDQDADITDGVLPDFTIDFPMLDFELLVGTYEGTMTVTYPDGSVTERKAWVIVREDHSGSMAIGYEKDVIVDRAAGQITCYYAPNQFDTHDTTVQLILQDNGQEYVLATSDVVHPGETLYGMTLDPSMNARLVAGQYNGCLRLVFSAVTDADSVALMNSDIDVDIWVS